ncbi:type III-D CRISPR-associated protein Csx19 [Methanosarcina barkeri]|uniref:TIGR03984 family CRISPR-associated protein n=1 Tax=Methanosarcina barkeri 227 TaxID=1434106 RepID=A0A0E3LQQ6_METBA|nr:CRISPR-associated protein Csx19 [Methanosarcina barkeri]AKB58686.1 hypothetical protein MSBR2_2170 [Methanosarcina barkeri 227]
MKIKREIELHSVKSHVENSMGEKLELSDFASLRSLINTRFPHKGFCVSYLDNEVLIGKYNGNEFNFYQNKLPEPKFIQKLRLFNETQELLLWRKKWKDTYGEFAFRLRVDEDGSENDVIDAKQVLWGTTAKKLDEEFTEISEIRGTKIILPFSDIEVDDKDRRVFILTRNYISYDTNDSSYQQAGYVDCRFVKFTDENGDVLGGELDG